MTDPETSPAPRPKLHCLGGQPIPEDLLADWAKFMAMSPIAQERIPELLRPGLASSPADEMNRRADEFCRRHDVSLPSVLAAVRVCMFLLKRAAALDLDRARFETDLQALSSGEDANDVNLGTVLGSYDALKKPLRAEILEATLFDHGKVLVGIDWRIDRVTTSDRGQNLDLPLALLTLHHREGHKERTRDGKTTLYLHADALRELTAACERIQEMLS